MERKVITVQTTSVRIDKYLKTLFPEYSREYLKLLCKLQYVKVDGKNVVPSDKVKNGQRIEIFLPQREDIWLNKDLEFFSKTEVLPFEIIYEDEDLLVINKHSGLIVHPSKKLDFRKSLLDYLLELYPKNKNFVWPLGRPFIVHRLDKDTSGVMLVAKTPQMQYYLSNLFQQREIKKVYRAIVSGKFREQQGEIVAPLEKFGSLTRISVSGKDAVTKFKVLSSNQEVTYLELYPLTGRTHQIRTHLSFINHPILGDVKYHGSLELFGKKIPRIMLHSYKIKFRLKKFNDFGGEEQWKEFTAKLPQDFCSILLLCGLQQ